MNYIITGGTGFIGTHLTNLIKERYPNAQVYNLDIVKPGTPNPVVKDYKPALRDGQKLQSTFIEYDIRKPIENLPFTPTEDDVIFNFAAVHRTPGHEDHEYFETNIRGAENVVAFAEKWNIKKIVFTSSIAPYGAAEELKKETTLPTPNTAYGISKLVAEKIHEKWQNGDAAHRQLTIVRPGVVFGKQGRSVAVRNGKGAALRQQRRAAGKATLRRLSFPIGTLSAVRLFIPSGSFFTFRLSVLHIPTGHFCGAAENHAGLAGYEIHPHATATARCQ